MEKIKLDKIVIVEGKYDKIRLSPILDAPIITTDGFGFFKNAQKRRLLLTLCKEKGAVILTDSDRAGLFIRSRLRDFLPTDKITDIYAPQIFGKERRKKSPSKDGLLGIEGIDIKILHELFVSAGLCTRESIAESTAFIPLTKAKMYEYGLSGGSDSAERRKELCIKLSLPENLGANQLLEAVNLLGINIVPYIGTEKETE